MSSITFAGKSLLASLLVVGSVQAQIVGPELPAPDAKPPGQVATPTSMPVDQSSPQGTLKLFSQAMVSGDVESIRSILLAETDAERKIAGVLADRAGAVARLQKASARFPGQESQAQNTATALAAAHERIDASQVILNGPTATVNVSSNDPGVPGQQMTMKQVDGQWRIPMSGVAPTDATAAEIDQRVEVASIETIAIGEIATEINDGKYTAMDEAAQAMQGKVMTAMAKRQADAQAKTTTQPTTAPIIP